MVAVVVVLVSCRCRRGFGGDGLFSFFSDNHCDNHHAVYAKSEAKEPDACFIEVHAHTETQTHTFCCQLSKVISGVIISSTYKDSPKSIIPNTFIAKNSKAGEIQIHTSHYSHFINLNYHFFVEGKQERHPVCVEILSSQLYSPHK